MKKVLGFILTMLVAVLSIINVNALDKEVTFYKRDLSGVNKITGAGTTYKTVVTSEGTKIVYCFNKKLDAPPYGSKLKLGDDSLLPNDIKTTMYIYILDNGYGGTWNSSVIGGGKFEDDQKYYITQVALWIAQGELDAETIKKSGTLGTAAYNLYKAAEKNSKVMEYTPEVTLDGNSKMTLSGTEYISGTIKITTKGSSEGKVNLVNAPAGSKIIVNGEKKDSGITLKNGTEFKISVPADKVKTKLDVKVTASTTAIRKKIYIYRYNENYEYQNVGLVYQDKFTDDDELTLNIVPTGELLITKVEKIDGKDVKLDGVTLLLTDSNGKEIAKWSTTDENPKRISRLTIGATYTLSELVAPDGYKKIGSLKVSITSPETKEITVVNTKNEPIKISKQDITNKEELPGATLVVTDSLGNEIDKWVSTNEPHYITKTLTPGIYYLTETIAPEGYALSTEKVSFTVKEDGTVDGDVIMYNTPKKGVKISKQDIATSKELPGATLTIKDANGKVIETWVSTNEPHYIENLPEGKYILIETKSPEGYGLSDEVIEFEIKYDGKPAETIVMFNSIIPDTGDINIPFIIACLIGTFGLGIFSFVKLSRQHS